MKRGISRRAFIAGAAAAPLVLTNSALAQSTRPGANERIAIGMIGLGGMGSGHLRFLRQRNDVDIVALCDVDKNHQARAVKMLGTETSVPVYEDFRRVLDQQDVDAVLIAAPDHWHGIMAVLACAAGKDVYVEKPASKTIKEGRAMLDAARYYKRVMQVGSQGRSTSGAQAAWNYINNGQIGAVTRVDCWHYPNPTGGDWSKNQTPPPELNWDMWLGPAKWVPYNPDRVHFNFRWFLDFGGGQIRDRGAHVLSVVSWCLGLDDISPVRVTATGKAPIEGMYDCPPNLEVIYEYEDPKLTITWKQPGPNPPDDNFGAMYHGTKGTLRVNGGDGHTDPEAKAKNYTPPSDGKHAFESPGHHQDWFRCIKTREKPHMDIAAGHKIATLCILANMSYRLGRPLDWDAENERVKDDEAANQLLGNGGRGVWHL